MKDSINASKPIKNLITEEELTNAQIAMDLNYSESQISHLKSGRRSLTREMAETSIHMYDNARYTTELLHKFSDGFAVPALDGRAVELHRLTLLSMLSKQTKEATEAIKAFDFSKPPKALEKIELEQLENAIDELLDVRLTLENWLIQIQVDYGISIKKRMNKMNTRWKARGWLQ